MKVQDEIYQWAIHNGIADLGFCSAEPLSGYADFVLQKEEERKCYLEIGYRSDPGNGWYTPRAHLPEAQGILVVLLPYSLSRGANKILDEGVYRISEASIFRDYHHLLQEQMQALAKHIEEKYQARSLCYSDTGPLNDKSLCVRAGLAKIGYHSLLLHPKYGSRFYIGYLLTELAFEDKIPDEEDLTPLLHPFCANCMRCAKACPNHAIDRRGSIDSNRCISFLTQSKEWETSLTTGLSLENYLYGCDICQQVCPLNTIPLPEFVRPPLVPSTITEEELVAMSNKEFSRIYKATSAGWIGKKKFIRNARYNRSQKNGLLSK